MSGLGGHIRHLWENYSLTFGQLKEILTKAASGTLSGTEKTDGQNIYLSYSAIQNEAKIARNQSHIKQGGLNLQETELYLAEKGAILDVFKEAFEVWEAAIGTLSLDEQVATFGADADVFYNAEIQDPRSSNVIKYDGQSLIVHEGGHAAFDRVSGKPLPTDIKANVQKLQQILDLYKTKNPNPRYNIAYNATKTLRELSDKVPLNNCIATIDAALQETKLTNEQTIGDYLVARLLPELDQKLPNISNRTRRQITQRILGQRGLNINSIVRHLSDPDRRLAKEIVADSKGFLSSAALPLAEAVHGFSVSLLDGLESMFIVNNIDEVQRIRKEVNKAIKTIKNCDNEHAHAILQNELRKLKHVDKISTATEGFVFEINGETYKFTGNFSPVNQILGLYTYGRGKKIPALKNLKIKNKPRKIGILPGGFKPPHYGHYEIAKKLSEVVDEVRIIIGQKPRDGITAEQSLKIWEIFRRHDSKLVPQIAQFGTPIKSAYEMMQEFDENDLVVFGVGNKDETDNRYHSIEKWKKAGTIKPKVHITTVGSTKPNLNSSEIRKMISEKGGNEAQFVDMMPEHLNIEELAAIKNILVENERVTVPAKKLDMSRLSSLVKEILFESLGFDSNNPGAPDDIDFPDKYDPDTMENPIKWKVVKKFSNAKWVVSFNVPINWELNCADSKWADDDGYVKRGTSKEFVFEFDSGTKYFEVWPLNFNNTNGPKNRTNCQAAYWAHQKGSFNPTEAIEDFAREQWSIGDSALLPENLFKDDMKITIKESDFQKSNRIKDHPEARARLLDKGAQENTPPFTDPSEKDKMLRPPPGVGALEEDELEEMSSASGGAISGYSGQWRKKYPGLIRELENFVLNILERGDKE